VTRGHKIALGSFFSLLVAGGVAWQIFLQSTGVAAASRDLPGQYARAQQQGLALTAEDLRALDTGPSAPAPEIARLLAVPKHNSYGAAPWLPGAPPDLKRARQELTEPHRKAAWKVVNEVEAGTTLRAAVAWEKNPFDADLSLGPFERARKVLLAQAGALAHAGRREDAVRHLSAARQLMLQATQHPNLIYGLARIKSFSLIKDTALELTEIDPDGGLDYTQAALGGWDFNLAYFAQGEVLLGAWMARNMRGLISASMVAGFNHSTFGDELFESTHVVDGVPRASINRAMLAEHLRFWNRIYETRDVHGRFTNLAETERVARLEYERLDRESFLADQIPYHAPWDLSDAIQTFRRTEAEHALLQDWVKILAFKRKNQRWPTSLAEAGVRPRPHPYAPGQFTQYQVGPNGVAIWMRGKDGLDHGGMARLPAFADEPDKALGDWSLAQPLARIGGPFYPRYVPPRR
jgi:hypothetical protein